MPDEVVIQVRFTIPAAGVYSAFSDALFYTQSEYAALTDPQLAAAKTARYEAWKAIIDAGHPPSTSPPLDADQLRQVLIEIFQDWNAVQQIAGATEVIPEIAPANDGVLVIQAVLRARGMDVSTEDIAKLLIA